MRMLEKTYKPSLILVYIKDKRWWGFKKTVQNVAYSILRYKENYIGITLGNDKEITPLNKAYRGKDSPTDILSFTVDIALNSGVYLGEIILSYDTIKKKAKENKIKFRDYTKMIVAHGILHLLGYDHESEEDFEIMSNLENKLSENYKYL